MINLFQIMYLTFFLKTSKNMIVMFENDSKPFKKEVAFWTPEL